MLTHRYQQKALIKIKVAICCSEPHIRYVKIIVSNHILYSRLFLGTLCIFPLGTLYPSSDNIERPKDVD